MRNQYWQWSEEFGWGRTERMTEKTMLKRNKEYEEIDSVWRWKIREFKPSTLNGRHVASLRSICEMLPGFKGKDIAHCVCGRPVSDEIHLTSEETDALFGDDKYWAFFPYSPYRI